MPDKNTRHTSSVALVLIDVINHFEFPDGDKILKRALPMAARLARLRKRCRNAGIPAIYVNDNFGQWRSDAKSLVRSCLASDCPGKPFVEPLLLEHRAVLVHVHAARRVDEVLVLVRHCAERVGDDVGEMFYLLVPAALVFGKRSRW